MTFTRRELIVFVFALIVCALATAAWVKEREARQKAQVTANFEQQIVAANAQAIHDRADVDAKYSAARAQESSQLKTPQQAAQVILRYLPAPPAAPSVPGQPVVAPAPQKIVTVDRNQLSSTEQAALPISPTYGILTADQLQSVARQELACDATTHSLTSCSADRVDLQSSLDARTKESASWEAAAKGGTKWQRVGHALKLIGCSAAGAGAGSFVSKRSPALGAAVGAGAGVTVCSIF